MALNAGVEIAVAARALSAFDAEYPCITLSPPTSAACTRSSPRWVAGTHTTRLRATISRGWPHQHVHDQHEVLRSVDDRVGFNVLEEQPDIGCGS